jgi:hypothetical protein
MTPESRRRLEHGRNRLGVRTPAVSSRTPHFLTPAKKVSRGEESFAHRMREARILSRVEGRTLGPGSTERRAR